MQEMHFVFMSVAVYTSRFSQYSAGSLILSTPLAHMHCMWGVWLQRVGVRISNSCYIVELWVSPTWLCLTQRNTHTCVSKKRCSSLILNMCRVGWAAGSDGLRWLCCVSASLLCTTSETLSTDWQYAHVCGCGSVRGQLQDCYSD